MIYSSEDMQTRAVLDTAARMCAAARTAPKTRGMDGLVTCVVTGEDKDRLAAHMRELAGRLDYAFFARDADNVDYLLWMCPCSMMAPRALPFQLSMG